MNGVEKSVFGSFFRICEYDSETFRSLNKAEPYLKIRDEDKDVDIIKLECYARNCEHENAGDRD